MRLDNDEFAEKNTRLNKEPIFVVEIAFDELNTDVMYFTNKTVTGLTGTIFNKTLVSLSATSQDLTPEKAHCSIGNIKFKCKDEGVSDFIKAKTDLGVGLKGKRMRVYAGYKGLNWSDFVITQTQIVSKSIDLYKGALTFHGADISRQMRKTLFILKETALIKSLVKTDLTIQVENTSVFETVFQPPTATSIAPSQEIGIIKIENGDVFELIQWTSKDATHFYGCTRGILGTPIIEVVVIPGERGETVQEFVYMSAPALMVAYALMTGSWYGYAGKFLPEHWNLGISTNYIKTTDFIDIPDLWDINDINAGIPALVQDVSEVEGKAFIEIQLYFMLSVYPPINNNGEIGLRRLAAISELGTAELELTPKDFVSHGQLKEDLNAVVNRYVIKWDWSVTRQIFRRTTILVDQGSIDFYKTTKTQVIELRTLYGSADSLKVIYNNFNNIRTRSAYAPSRLSGVLTPNHNALEVGDVPRVKLHTLNNLNRNFEIQYTAIDWVKGGIQVDLFGSNGLVGPLIPESTTLVDTAFLATNVPLANWLTPTNFPGKITSADGVTHITGDITLTGNDLLNDVSCIYYCDEDLIQDLGAVITHTKNIQIRAKGYFTSYQDLNGKGQGYPGGVDTSTIGDVFSPHIPRNVPGKGTVGGVGRCSAGAGIEFERRGSISGNGRKWGDAVTHYGTTEARDYYRLPNTYELRIQDNVLVGLPNSLIGCSGTCGGGVNFNYKTSYKENRARGGDGGASGAGLVIISAGFNQGENAKIDLSGIDATPGESFYTHGMTFHAGSGAGGSSGGLIIISTDSAQYTETRTEFNTLLINGVTSIPSNIITHSWGEISSGNSYKGSPSGYPQEVENDYENFARLIYLDASSTFTEELPDYVETEPNFTLTTYIKEENSSIEVTVTPPPGDVNYVYSEVYWRVKGTSAWIPAESASHESVFIVPSNGAIIEVEIRPVSKALVATVTGYVKEIMVADRFGRTDIELAVVYPFDPITNLKIKGISGTVFSTKDAEFEWSGDNNSHDYFNLYDVEIYSGAQLLRTEKSVLPLYTYSYDKNVSDYLRLNSISGVYLSIEISVKATSKYYNLDAVLYSGPQVIFSSTASTFNSPDNLRFVQSTRDQIATDISAAEQSAKDYADTNFVTQVTLSSDLAGLQSQIDGNITTWFYTGIPTVSNAPASNWTTTTEKDNQLGDLYYDKNTGYAYRFMVESTVYSWQQLADSDITTALANAQTAQDTADRKRRVFNVTPVPPYDDGDLWDTGNGLKRSTVNRVTTYTASDWIEVADRTNYSDSRIDNTQQLWDELTDRPADSQLLNNMLDWSDWQAGTTGDTASYTAIGVSASNNREIVEGPFGEDTIVWEAEDDTGFITPAVPVDPSKTYRISLWIKVVGTVSTGNIYFYGTGANRYQELNNDSTSFAFFYNTTPTLSQRDRWVLLVGYILPHNTTRTVSGTLLGGLYDPETGLQQGVLSGNTKFLSTTTDMQFRAYTPSGDLGKYTLFARPRIDILDGNEVSLTSLLLGAKTSNLLNTNTIWDNVSGTPNAPADNADVTNYIDPRISNDELNGVIAAAAAAGATNQQIFDIQAAYNEGATTQQILDITAAALSANWAQVTGAGRPADNADITNYTDTRISNDELNGVIAAAAAAGATTQQIFNIQAAYDQGATNQQILDITAAAISADWAQVSGVGRPADNADVTANNTANDTVNVGGTPATQIISDLAGVKAQWSVKTVIADLEGGVGFYNDGLVTRWMVNAQLLGLGENAGISNQGANSLAIGNDAGSINQGANNVAIGKSAGYLGQQYQSVAIGFEASKTGQGAFSVSIGYKTSEVAQSTFAVAIGHTAAQNNQGSKSIAIGQNAANTNQGPGAIAIGRNSGANNQGENAIALGYRAGVINTDTQGVDSIAIGTNSNSKGLESLAIGYGASTTGLNGIAIGKQAGAGNYFPNSPYNNWVALGANSYVNGSNEIQLGDSITTVYAYGSVQNRSDQRDKADIRDTTLGLDFIDSVRPVEFKWDYREDYVEQTLNEDGTTTTINHPEDGSKKRSRYHQGFIAQEVKAVMTAQNIDFGGYQDHSINGGADVKSLGYEEFIAPIIKAIQELKAEIELLKNPL